MNSNRAGWATTMGSGCKGEAGNKLPLKTSKMATCRRSNSPSQKNRLQCVRASSCLNLWKPSSFFYHHFMSVDFHIGVPLKRGSPGLESSLPNKKRDIFKWQKAQSNTEPQCVAPDCNGSPIAKSPCLSFMGRAQAKPIQDVLSQRDSEPGDKDTTNHLKHLQAFPWWGRFLSPPHQMQSSEQEWVSERRFSAQGERCWGTLWLEGANLYCLPQDDHSRKLLV